ncbi:hypothetical protein ACEQPO_03960 [Bacillus sp. SL00103]
MILDAAIVDIDPINHTANFRIALHGPEHFQKSMALKLSEWFKHSP